MPEVDSVALAITVPVIRHDKKKEPEQVDRVQEIPGHSGHGFEQRNRIRLRAKRTLVACFQYNSKLRPVLYTIGVCEFRFGRAKPFQRMNFRC